MIRSQQREWGIFAIVRPAAFSGPFRRPLALCALCLDSENLGTLGAGMILLRSIMFDSINTNLFTKYLLYLLLAVPCQDPSKPSDHDRNANTSQTSVLPRYFLWRTTKAMLNLQKWSAQALQILTCFL